MTKTIRIHLPKMCCASEERLIRRQLEDLPEVAQLQFNLVERVITVQHSLEYEDILFERLASIGMQPARQGFTPPAGLSRRWWTALFATGGLAVAAELSAWFYSSDNSPLTVGMALSSMLLGGRDTFGSGWIALRSRSFNMNFLMTLAIVGALLIGKWPEAAMVTFLFSLAQAIEKRSMDKARQAIQGLLCDAPTNALVKGCGSCCSGGWESRPVAEIRPGQIVRVRPGERVALDGSVVSGSSSIEQGAITGEGLPVDKGPGDPVYAGTLNKQGTLDFEVTASAGQTTLDRIVATVRQAQHERAPSQRWIDTFASYYTPTMLAIAFAVAFVPPLAGAPLVEWVYRALVLLVVACPCALVLSTPITLMSGLAAAARQGIFVKGGGFLESGCKLKVVAFDKTGTLTEGHPEVTDFDTCSDLPASQCLRLAASLESHSEHPLASAVVQAWQAQSGDEELLPVTDFEALPGRGLRGTVAGHAVALSSLRQVTDSGLDLTPLQPHLRRLEQEGKTVIVLYGQTRILAALGIADRVRSTSAEAVAMIHELGLKTLILSGDRTEAVRSVADELQVGQAFGDLLPEEKLAKVVETLARNGFVAMVGDGVNDAPALARSSLGFAMGAAGSATALETADVALMDDDPRKVAQFIRISRSTRRILTQNVILSLLIKGLFFCAALAGKATLWMAIFADMGTCLLVVFNGLRLLSARGI